MKYQENYAKKGVEFKLGCAVTAVGGGKVTFTENGKEASVPQTRCSAPSAAAVTAGYGLETLECRA